jgi:predicted dehydrogenase
VVLSWATIADQTIRIGFVGAGNNTRKHHIPKLHAQPGVELVAVANRTKESGERVAREFGISRVYEDWRELVRAGDVDAVCIGTWPYMHYAITKAAIEAGKHVLCEARMAMNATEGRRMLEAARRAPHLVTQLVPAPHTLEVDATIEKLLAEGYAGEVLAAEIQAAQGQFVEPEAPLHWRQDVSLSGLNILTMGIWYEAMMRWLGVARRVTAMTKVAVPRRRDAGGAWHEVRVGSRRHPGRASERRHRLRQRSDRSGSPRRGVVFRTDGTRLERRARLSVAGAAI